MPGWDEEHRRDTFFCPLVGPRFEEFKEGLKKEDVILVEATTLSFWFYDQVIDRVRDCYVLNSHKMESGGNKTDKIDANKLLDRLSYNELMESDPAKLPYVYVPPQAVRELRGLLTTYQLLKKQITQSINRIHSIYKQNGIRLERKKLSCKTARETILSEMPLPTLWKVQVVTLINTLEAVEVEKRQMQDLICLQGYKLFPREVELLISIKGFSPLTATALMADVVRVERFPDSKKFCCYLRTAPRVRALSRYDASGPHQQAGKIADLHAANPVYSALRLPRHCSGAVQGEGRSRQEALCRSDGHHSQGADQCLPYAHARSALSPGRQSILSEEAR